MNSVYWYAVVDPVAKKGISTVASATLLLQGRKFILLSNFIFASYFSMCDCAVLSDILTC